VNFLLTLACKNLFRYKRRTIITAVAIAMGLMSYILVDSLFLGIKEESVRNLKWYETSSARIYAKGYWEERMQIPLDNSIQTPQKTISLLAENGYTSTTRTMFSADMILFNDDFGEDGNLPVLVTAIDPEKDNEVFHFGDTLVEGRFLEKGDENGILIGSWFAEDIKAKVGYWVTLVTRGNGGFYEAMDMQIVGILNCPNPNVNRTLLMMDINTASERLAMEGAVTEIDVRFSDTANTEKEMVKIRSLLSPFDGELESYSWEEMAKDYLAVLSADQGGSYLILFLVFIIAAVGISNTMLMAIQERIRELGTMRSLGLGDRKILSLFILEAGGIGLLGSLLGLLLGILGNFYLVHTGIDFGWIMRDTDIGYRIQNVLRGTWSFKSLAVAFSSGIVLSMLVAYLPVRKALRMDIPSCLRHQ
jgi:ABC-type lipoprotein release transport system permease subunit